MRIVIYHLSKGDIVVEGGRNFELVKVEVDPTFTEQGFLNGFIWTELIGYFDTLEAHARGAQVLDLDKQFPGLWR